MYTLLKFLLFEVVGRLLLERSYQGQSSNDTTKIVNYAKTIICCLFSFQYYSRIV